ncbi:hypothetical protein [Mesorhizobium sp. M0243]|uniref:hypothetical protein n=1 Tax=Mesorhizobium sp. M0243 TaxID=2956925 RepID=UPI003336C1A7
MSDLKLGSDNTPRFQWVIQNDPIGPNLPYDVELRNHSVAGVVPTKGSLVENWMLVIPRQPLPSLADASINVRKEVLQIGRHESAAGTGSKERWFNFEHGSRNAGDVIGCGVDQAHLHVVPLPFDLLRVATTNQQDLAWFEVNTHDPWSEIPVGVDYYLVSDFLQTFLAYPATGESQYFRKLIARELGQPDRWDYRKYGCETNVKATIDSRHLRN